MIRRGIYPIRSLWNELDDMMAEMEGRFAQTLGGYNNAFSQRVLPAITGECRVDVLDHENEAVIVADLPGAEKEDIKVKLINPRTLEISYDREKENEEENKETGYYMRERTYGSMKRAVLLPADVVEAGSTASFKNGVLEIHLKKSESSSISEISIE
ncbi:Hsp20/alpha crystallin family protein [Methanomicrobium antiquum]|uniref:Hsp20/alpha crystallin family protein n=1 Tax=Methanomicrobium antiquum TaxID=487686 RepID=A0AAF0FX44_9EURY|nr:Hsp20/alpha crystallin family protein [Methanomicrobium antiquum]WFN37580.1 Hsp20/alpha crystallin family protein [Methanomicrobium antiquum]